MASFSCSGKELESYYVKELTKFISPNKVPVGSKLKRLSQIPGRNRTPVSLFCHMYDVLYFLDLFTHITGINYSMLLFFFFSK